MVFALFQPEATCMKFYLLNRCAKLRRQGTYLLLVLALAIFALGTKLSSSSASTQNRSFTIVEAITKSADGKQITAKAGFELVRKGEGEIVARKKEANTTSSDTINCFCMEFSPCAIKKKSPCCNHSANEHVGRDLKCSISGNTVSATCSGNCDQCKWQ
jgi:hypothetical protein